MQHAMQAAGAQQASSHPAQNRHAPTLPDAVRRCRWIAADLGAAEFAVFLAERSATQARLVPCFDSAFPSTVETGVIPAEHALRLARHASTSSAPCWWHEGPECASSRSLAELVWCEPIAAASAGSGIAFPVQSEPGRLGLVAFLGERMSLTQADLFDVHARCFTLFETVAAFMPCEGAGLPNMSRRELQCLKLTASGHTSEDIARLLRLSVHTANQHLSNALQKLDAVNRMHAVAKALRMGLIE